ncbi:hypothetical protein FQ192_23645 [Pseudomonas sp. ANT_J12]|nr:hypothetical protein FQ192_23645 [Pseudomonas sp. ANT_J12]
MLAKAECQPTLMLDVPASSRASFAPTEAEAGAGAEARHVRQYQRWMCRPLRKQALLLQKQKQKQEQEQRRGASGDINVGCAGLFASKLCSYKSRGAMCQATLAS